MDVHCIRGKGRPRCCLGAGAEMMKQPPKGDARLAEGRKKSTANLHQQAGFTTSTVTDDDELFAEFSSHDLVVDSEVVKAERKARSC